MRPGPKPKPTARKEFEGNPGKRPLNENEPTPPDAAPKKPIGKLNKAALREWNRMQKTLHDMGVLTEIDHAVFEAYCQAYADWMKYTKLVDEEPIIKSESGYFQISAYVTLADKAFKRMMSCIAELGLTPSSRSRIHIAKKPKKGKAKLLTLVT